MVCAVVSCRVVQSVEGAAVCSVPPANEFDGVLNGVYVCACLLLYIYA